MAKMKNKKRVKPDDVHRKREAARKKTLNPFEVHINKEKMTVLGRKGKNDRGLPGVSRAKALKKRKDTLLQEYKLRNKSNKFTDRRIGERNRALEDDEKIIARFSAIRSRKHNRKQIFNLADDEVLTHKGQTLAQIEKFEPTNSDSDEFEEERNDGKLDSGFVGDAHFGGGVLTKTGKEGAKTHKELIDQLIAESKKRKAEKQKTKEATLELTEKLDDDWKDLLPLVSKKPKESPEEETKAPVDDYDKVMRELRFEARGTVSDRLKSEDEIAKEEKEKLEKLEQERLDRMQGFNTDPRVNHRSADDLDDDVVYEADPDYMISYNEKGESNIQIDATIERLDEDSHEQSEPTEESDEENEEQSSSDEEEDNLSDLKESEDEEVSDEDTNTTKPESSLTTQDPVRNEEIMAKAREELPFTFKFPENYEEFDGIFERRTPEQKHVIIERMIKCNHPSLSEGNKEKLGVLFVYLLQHFNDLATDKSIFQTFANLAPKLYELAQINPECVHSSIKEVIREKHDDFNSKKTSLPGIELLVFFKLIGLLFSTSDFRHQIVTPCIVFIEQILTKCKFKTRKDIAYGLYLTVVILEYTTLSKRYLPATVNFLSGILHMAIPKSSVKIIKVRPPFRPTCNSLVVFEETSDIANPRKMQLDDLFSEEFDAHFKIGALHTAIKLVGDFSTLLDGLSSHLEIFGDIINFLHLIPAEKYPDFVRNDLVSLKQSFEMKRATRKLNYIVMAQKKPKALRLYEPKIEPVFDGKRRKYQSKEKAERDKLVHKLKKETKGALREIRRDRAFLGRVKLQQKIQSDNVRKDKVKRLFSEAAIQQSELNQLDRKKKL